MLESWKTDRINKNALLSVATMVLACASVLCIYVFRSNDLQIILNKTYNYLRQKILYFLFVNNIFWICQTCNKIRNYVECFQLRKKLMSVSSFGTNAIVSLLYFKKRNGQPKAL